MIVDLFAGPGGWDVGSVWAGVDGPLVGIEHDHDANLTATAAGFARVEADVAAYPPRAFGQVDGLIASPPCQAFSLAGKGAGRDAAAELLAHVRACADGWVDPPDRLCGDDVRADLTLQPLRWAWALRPRWVACEQVPPALPLWEETARVLEGWGYSTWAGRLNAEEYGVPQTRTRAFLIARRDGVPAGPPEPTHTAYDARASDGGRTPQPSLFGTGLRPWVSMAEGLGWVDGDRPAPSPTVTTGGGETGGIEVFAGPGSRERARLAIEPIRGAGATERHGDRPERPVDEPAPTVTSRFAATNRWTDAVVRTGTNSMKHSRDPDEMVPYERPLSAPAPTVDAKVGGAWRVRMAGAGAAAERTAGQRPRGTDEPAHTITGAGTAAWVRDRPATTVVGTFRPDVTAAPGWRTETSRQDAPGSVQVTLEQAARLQSFPDGYPWRGSKTSRHAQVGNAVPPLLAAHVLRPLLDRG